MKNRQFSTILVRFNNRIYMLLREDDLTITVARIDSALGTKGSIYFRSDLVENFSKDCINYSRLTDQEGYGIITQLWEQYLRK